MIKILLTIIVGIIAGLISGFAGTTTATTFLPGLLLLNIVPNFQIAAGTTLLAILPPLSLGGIYEYYKNNNIDYKAAAILVITALISTYIGAKYSNLASNQSRKRILAFYMICVAIFLLYSSYIPKHNK